MNLIAAKEGSEILFTREVGGVLKSLKYDFKDDAFYSEQKNGKWKEVVRLGRFFSGITDADIVNAFEDGAYKEFVRAVLEASRLDHSASVGKKLSMISKVRHLEGYFIEGVKIHIPTLKRVRNKIEYQGIKHSFNEYQKEVRLLMKESGVVFSVAWENAYFTGEYVEAEVVYYKDFIINLATHIRKNYYRDLDVYRWFLGMVSKGSCYYGRYGSQLFDKFIKLSNKYKLEYKHLFDYLVKLERTEALDFAGALSNLEDYISMNDDLGNTRAPKYPDNLRLRHDITARNYRLDITGIEKLKFQRVIKKYPLDWMQKNWAVVTPMSADEVKEEGNKLHHCVSQYITKVCNETCVILFMRDFTQGAEPLVTVEYNQHQNEIVQARGSNNRPLTDEEVGVLLDFAKARRIRYFPDRVGYNNYDPTQDLKRDKERKEREEQKYEMEYAVGA